MLTPASRVIPITADAPTRDCVRCLRSPRGPVCRTSRGIPCGSPALSGDAAQLRRLLQALSQSLGEPVEGAGNRLVRSLRLSLDEVELELAVAADHDGMELHDAAFQTLRRLLPDTDIYVRHAR